LTAVSHDVPPFLPMAGGGGVGHRRADTNSESRAKRREPGRWAVAAQPAATGVVGGGGIIAGAGGRGPPWLPLSPPPHALRLHCPARGFYASTARARRTVHGGVCGGSGAGRRARACMAAGCVTVCRPAAAVQCLVGSEGGQCGVSSVRISALDTLKRYSKALEYEYKVKTAVLGTLKRYSILSLTLYLE
jgi:hypothetical protein